MKQNKKTVKPQTYFFSQMFVQQAFGNYKKAEAFANKLEKYYSKKTLTDSLWQNVNRSLSSFYALNAMQKFDYAKVAENYEKIIKNFSNGLDSTQIDNYENTVALFSTLKNIPPQKINRPPKDVELQSFRNKFNHLLVPVVRGNVQSQFVFDTGASFAMISDSIAQLMNMTILPVDIKVLTSTHLQIQPKLAVADSFYVGDILFENVVFLVSPQSDLTFEQVDYAIYGLVGFPQIMQMQEIRFEQTGKIIVPRKAKRQSGKNMFLDGYNPVIEVFNQNDTLLFRLDTGAKTSELSCKYFEKHKENILQNTKKNQVMRGGAGGLQESEEYTLKNFSYKIGKTIGTLPEISVIANDYEFSRLFDGNLGQDILLQYKEIILNFKDLYLKLVK
ncbi:MAG: aspartyl protease family protein [Paludibacter sp.]|nr:aspartyl protease family protein [Paludibacter sp.]